jgi:hypothetical protein
VTAHVHHMVIVCDHVRARPSGQPDVLCLQNGEVQFAVCFACTRQVNSGSDSDEPPEAFKPLCVECARICGIPTAAKMRNGFYERHAGEWIRQPSSDDEVN